jgi:DNA polymerase-3 subunit alpha
VFQLEGPSSQKGCKRLRPNHIKDIIAAMALFRPATMNSGATESYIQRKHGEEAVFPRNEMIDRVTKETYGILLFQEQVISILRELGMDADNLTKFLKSVKASNSNIGDAGKVIDGYKEMVWAMAVDADFSKRDWEWFWSCATGFAAYGFNQAHSTAYGITAYRCGYLATHHPVEFFAALLAVAAGSPKKEALYLRAAREEGISLRRATVNDSGVLYVPDSRGKSIRKGLMAIKGIGEPTAKKIVDNRPESGFSSIEEFCRLTKVSGSGPYLNEGALDIGVVGKLYEAGALDCLEDR